MHCCVQEHGAAVAHRPTVRHGVGGRGEPLSPHCSPCSPIAPLPPAQEGALILLANAGANLQTINSDGERADALLPERLRVQLMEG